MKNVVSIICNDKERSLIVLNLNSVLEIKKYYERYPFTNLEDCPCLKIYNSCYSYTLHYNNEEIRDIDLKSLIKNNFMISIN